MKRFISALCAFSSSFFFFLIPVRAQFAQVYTVNTTADTVVAGACTSGSAGCSLRGAIQAANSVSDSIINFAIPELCATTGCVINLTQALPDIYRKVTIDGPGADRLTVQRNSQDKFRIFTILNFTVDPVTISGLTISNGYSFLNTDNDLRDGGGVLHREGTRLNIINCTFSGNVAAGKGGAIANVKGTVNITGSTLSGNSSVGFGVDDGGGAISNFGNDGSGTVNVTNSTISGNKTGNFGAGIANQGTLVITNSNISDNSFLSTPLALNRGGGIYNRFGRVTIINSTLSGNSAGGGGGIWTNSRLNVINSTLITNSSRADGGGAIHNTGVNGTTNITNSTISGNSSGTNGGGIFNSSSSMSIVNVKSSIIANNTAPSGPDVSGISFFSQGFNLIGKNDGAAASFPAGNPNANNDIVGTSASPVDPKLDPNGLYDNGGPTRTIALLSTSPAVDKGTAAGLTGILTTDQRGTGFPRTWDDPAVPPAVGGDNTDIGAFELRPPPITAGVSSLINEGCPPTNGVIDPGETATVNLTLMNRGTDATTNLVATLQPSANVLAPSGPQNYGAIATGAMAGRDFTFTAEGNCGDTITLTLQLQDGATSLGTVGYTFTLGCNTACAGAPRISTSTVLSCSGSTTVATVTLCNSGTATANNVVLTTARLGGVSGTPLPQSVGTLAPGACVTTTVIFSGAPSGTTTLQVSGTYTGGSFNSNRRVTAP